MQVIERGELLVGRLEIPAVDEEEDMEAMEEGVEEEFAGRKLCAEP